MVTRDILLLIMLLSASRADAAPPRPSQQAAPATAPAASEPATFPSTVIVFGDSIAEGGALPKDQRAKAWVNVVQAEAGDKLRVVNEGKGGRPTDSVKEFDAMLQRRPRADVLVIALGTNDSRDVSDACVPKAVANVRAMVDRGRRAYGPNLRVVLVGPPNIRKDALGPTKPIANQREAKVRALGEGFAALADELRCGYVSLYGIVPAESLTKDGVHPDAAGNAAIARVMAAALSPEARR
jgi:acyl-CoA thioesterase-1